jgi:DNA-binding MarR family transcriptional regulator
MFLGTNADNMADKIAKGHQTRGQDCGNAKVSEEAVRRMRELYASGSHLQRELADMFGITQPQVSLICSAKNWSHV